MFVCVCSDSRVKGIASFLMFSLFVVLEGERGWLKCLMGLHGSVDEQGSWFSFVRRVKHCVYAIPVDCKC